MAEESALTEIKLDPKGLYREETYTDRQAGTLRRLVPVDARGKDDAGRPVVFVGQASLMTPGGALPLQFEIDAESLEDALEKYPAVAQQALQETVAELKRLHREAQSSIVVPQGGAGGGPGPGGIPGGGKIQI